MSSMVCALAGNPNTGKTSLFNALTGLRQKVGNWPGVTVERKEGVVSLGGRDVVLVDLPGIYSLGAASVDEHVASEFLRTASPRLTVVVADASNLERSLYLALQLREQGYALVLALNMADLAEAKGMKIDISRLESLMGAPVVPTVAPEGKGLDALRACMTGFFEVPVVSGALAVPYGEKVSGALGRLEALLEKQKCRPLGLAPRGAALKIAEGDGAVWESLDTMPCGKAIRALVEEENRCLTEALGYDLQTALIERRWVFLSGVASQVVDRDLSLKDTMTVSDRIDTVVTSRIFGLPLFLAVAWGIFHTVYLLGDPVAEHLDGLFGFLGELVGAWVTGWGASPLLASFVTEGLVAGVGSVVVFVPHIFLLFAFLAVLEDSGYMARGVFVMDRILRALGLHGKSFIPMLLGFGCNVPSIMATRILERPRDRMITLLVLPFMSCSARLPVFLLFAGVFFGDRAGTAVFSLYLLGIVVAVAAARLLGGTLFRGEPSQLIMELPPYHLPRFGAVLRTAWERASLFLKKAGTFILASVVLVWVLASLPFGVEYGSEQSLVGRLGSLLAPLLAPAGFPFWQAGVALFFGFLAKEVVLGTFGTLFGVGEEGLAAVLPTLFTPLSAYAFLVMTLLYVPCVAVVAAFHREVNNWRWTAFLVLFTTAVGYLVAVVVYQGGRLFGLS